MDIRYKRMNDETVDSYIYRMCRNKDLGKYELTWKQVGDILNEQLEEEFTESKYRKEYQAMQRGMDLIAEKQCESEDVLEEIEQAKDELYKLKTRARDWVRVKSTILRDEARQDELKDILREEIRNLDSLKVNVVEKDLNKNSAILMLSDLHYGLDIDNFWNKYNPVISRERIDELASQTVKYCNIMNVDELYLANLNDLLSGGLHLTTRIFESVDTVQQAIAIGEIISNMMISIQCQGIKVNYISTTDNHSRRSTNFRESVEGDSWTKIIDEFIRLRVGNNINILENVFDEQIAYFEIGDRKIFAVHGHRDKPKEVIQNMIDATNIIPTHVLMGHYHSKSGFQKANTKVFVNGSIVGVDQYAKDCRYFNKPSQTLLVFDSENEVDIDIKL